MVDIVRRNLSLHMDARARGLLFRPKTHRRRATPFIGSPLRTALETQPKYSIIEVERRWLVAPSALSIVDGQPYRELEDLYVGKTQLRLRKVTSANGGVVFKLCKKYVKCSSLSQPTTNLYLSEVEYRTLAQLEGNAVRKRRYSVAGGSIDVYYGSPAVAVFEVEFESVREAELYIPPSFVGKEVTNDEAYSGAALASGVAQPGVRRSASPK